MYASQVWATPYLRQGKEMDNNSIQKWLPAVLKRTQGERDTIKEKDHYLGSETTLFINEGNVDTLA